MLNNERTLVCMSVYCYRAGGCCAGVTVSALFRHRGRQVTVYDIAAKLPTIDVLRDRCKGLALDGSDLLEILLDDIVDRYVKFAEDYHEIEVAPTGGRARPRTPSAH